MIIFPLRKAIGGSLAASLALGAALSAAQPAAAQYAVPGAPGVADVSVVQGDVVIVRGDSGAQIGAAINTPMLPGDYISTAGGSRAEVQFDGISMLRLAPDTQVRIVNLDPGSREVQLASGTAELAVLRGGDGGSQIDTPSLTVRPARAGDYRVTVSPNGETLVTVRSGLANVSSANGSENVTPGSTLVGYGPYSNAQVSMRAAIAYDAFDDFNQRCDRDVVASYNANQYLSPALAGYSDFANYGQWYDVPGYGESWAPYDQADNWSPYSDGQWVWEPGYGYTWIGNESWGYVPYHYGNWYYAQSYNQWMWQPPSYQYQNPNALASAWLPAMVGFFMTGGNGNIGWVPLAPGEQYVPWYAGFGANAVFPQTMLSRVNVTDVYNVYRNIRYVKVVRAIPVNRFRDGDFSHPVVVPARDVRQITLVRGAVPIVPTKAILGVRPAATAVRLSTRFQQAVFAKKAPEIARTASFDRQAAAVKTTPAAHPVSQAPARNETFEAPLPAVKTATKPVAPERTAAPLQQRFVPPQQRIGTPQPRIATPPAQRPAPQVQHSAPPPERRPRATASPVPL